MSKLDALVEAKKGPQLPVMGRTAACILSFLLGYGFATFKDSLIGIPVPRTCNCGSSSIRTSDESSSSTTAFDQIVQSAYEEVLLDADSRLQQQQDVQRPIFDIDYWEKQSNLTTNGGLGHADRIKLGEIYSKAESIFEYGLGESTYMANHLQVPRYAGIDSDPIWVGMARDKVSNHFRFYLADIGPTIPWGYPYPQNNEASKNVLNYQLAPLIVEPKPFDVYMIDGRYRLACALASFLHASARGADPTKTIVLIHDCKGINSPSHVPLRREYRQADHLLNLTSHSNGWLCIFQRFPSTTDDQLMKAWKKNSKVLQRR